MAQRAQITVKFEGSDEPVVLSCRPIGLMAAERKWGGNAFVEHPIEAMLFGSWLSQGSPGADFDAWVATIVDIETDTPDPTSATPPEPSPNSP